MRCSRIPLSLGLAMLPALLSGQVRKEEPVGLVRVPGGAKVIRAGDASALSARVGDVLFAGDILRSGDAAVSFTWCPGKVTQSLQPKGEIILESKQIRVKSGRLSDNTPVRACFLPALARLGAASEQHYGVSLTRGLPQDEGLVALAQMPEAVRHQLAPVEEALAVDREDVPALLARAAVLEKGGLLANAAHDYRAAARLWPEALWLKGKLFELDEALALKAAQAASAQLGGQMYSVLIGISKYQKLPPDLQLNYAHADALTFADHLRSPRGGGLPAANVNILTNEKATTGAVRMALDQIVKGQLNPKDTLVLFVAAHGVVDSNGSKAAYILTHDSDPQDLASTAYGMGEFRDVIEKALKKAGRVIVYVDICRAGAIGSIRSTSVASSLEQLNNFEGELFGFMAAGPKELSYEGPEFAGGTRHGAFTYFVLRGLQGEADTKSSSDGKSDAVVTVRELVKWVPLRVSESTKDRQLPKELGSMSRDVALSWLDQPGIDISGNPRWLEPQRPLLASDKPILPAVRTKAADEFETALERGRVLPGEFVSAVDLLPALRNSLSDSEYRARENQLRIELDNRAQQILLRYLEGDQAPQAREDFDLGSALTATALKLTPESVLLQARNNFFAGRSLLFEKKYAQAADLLEKSIALDPGGAYAWNALGIAWLQQARFSEAIAAFKDSARRASHWSYPLHNLALASAESGDYKAGIRYYQQAIGISPDAGYLHYNLGILYEKLNKRSEAERLFREALRRMDGRPEPLNALGSLYYSEGRTDEAEKLYREALKRQPRFAPALHNLAVLNAERRDFKSTALEMWEQVLAIDPDYAISRLSMAEFLTRKGDTDRAIEEYRELLRRNPVYAAARLGLAETYDKAGKLQEALEQFRAIVQMDGANSETLEKAGDLAARAGHAAEARQTWQRALDAPGDNGTKKRLRRKIHNLSEQPGMAKL